MPSARPRPSAATRNRVARAAGDLGAAAVQQMETDHEWYRSLSAENRSWVGLVAQAGITSFLDWFGGDQAQPAVTADVSTLMVRVAVPVTHGRTFNPFGSVGAGFARAMRPPPPGESLQRTDTQFGIEVGGGTTTRLTDRIGLRTAATYYKVLGPPGNFHGAPGSGIVYTNVLREFSLIRVSVGIDIRLSGSKTGQSQ